MAARLTTKTVAQDEANSQRRKTFKSRPFLYRKQKLWYMFFLSAGSNPRLVRRRREGMKKAA
jgi:hypothetical protein